MPTGNIKSFHSKLVTYAKTLTVSTDYLTPPTNQVPLTTHPFVNSHVLYEGIPSFIPPATGLSPLLLYVSFGVKYLIILTNPGHLHAEVLFSGVDIQCDVLKYALSTVLNYAYQ